ncbi:hypothetical protein C8F01DRAFT_1094669 [Mycena amicta]|nr:hypothetical protein C8F01DRAFT_1094669 [Mycena amicta]
MPAVRASRGMLKYNEIGPFGGVSVVGELDATIPAEAALAMVSRSSGGIGANALEAGCLSRVDPEVGPVATFRILVNEGSKEQAQEAGVEVMAGDPVGVGEEEEDGAAREGALRGC